MDVNDIETSPTAIRIQGGTYDRDKPGYRQDPTHASRCTYLAEPVCTEPAAPADGAQPDYAVIHHGPKNGYKVCHVASGRIIPAAARIASGTYAAPGVKELHWGGRGNAFRTKPTARAFMRAVAEAGILPTDRVPSRDEVRLLGEWFVTTYGEGDGHRHQ